MPFAQAFPIPVSAGGEIEVFPGEGEDTMSKTLTLAE